jgi:DNA-directed RNA polymerase specialized sigma24 family protein
MLGVYSGGRPRAPPGRANRRDAIARLPSNQRAAIELRMAGLTGVQIAGATRRSHDAVRMLQRRATERLRQDLGAFAGTKEGRHGA